ncbi:hypothetical protein AAKU55_003139 [Oxalobacteraceae bacterium GrIS 1.11]
MPGAVTVGALVINLSANIGSLKTDMADATNAVKTSSQNIVNAWAGVSAETDRASAAGRRLVEGLRDEIATFGMTSAELTQHKANLNGVGAEAQALIARLQGLKSAEDAFKASVVDAGGALNAHGKEAAAAGGHMDGFSFATTGAKRELLVLAHELSQGNFKKFGGSMLVLGEQTGAASLLFSAAGLTAIGLAAGIAFIAAEAYKGATEIDNFSKAMIVTNGASGLTRDSLHEMAASMESASTGGIRAAIKTLEELSATGHYSSASIEATGAVVLKLASLTGESSETIIKQFDGMSGGVAKWAAESTKQYNFINGVQYEHIRQLDLHGQKELALIETMHLLDESLDTQKQKVSFVTANYKGWAEMLGIVDVAFKKFLTGQTLGEKVTSEMDKLVELKAKLARIDPGAMNGNLAEDIQARIAAQRKVVTAAITAANNEELSTAKKQIDDKANLQSVADRVEIDLLMKKIMTKEQKRTLAEEKINGMADRENARAKAQGQAEVVTMGQRQAMIDAADEKYKDKAVKGQDARSAILEGALLKQRTEFDREKSIYDERGKMLDMYHAKFGMSDADYFSGETARRAEFIKSEAAAFSAEAALINGTQTKNPEEVEASKNKYATLLKQHLDFLDKMRNAGGEDSVKLVAAQQQAFDDYAKAASAAGDVEIKKVTEAIAKQREHNVEIGLTKGQIEAARQASTDAGTQRMQDDADAIAMLLEQNQVMTEQGAIAVAVDGQAKQIYVTELGRLQSLIAARRALAAAQGIGAAADAQQAASKAAANQSIQDWKHAGASIADSLSSAFGTAGKAMGTMFKAYSDGVADQLEIDKQRAETLKGLNPESPAAIAAVGRARQAAADVQLKSYGDMASAAKGFFDKNSAGYKIIDGLEKEMRLFQMANQAEKLVTSLFVSSASAAGVVAGQAVETGAVLAGQAEQNAAKAPGVFMAFMSAMGPWGMAAAAVAIAAVLGGAFSGGGSVDVAKDRQAATGTGTVLGDAGAKSESIAHSLEIVAKDSGLGLVHSASMDTSLKQLVSGISGLSSLLIRSTNLTAPTAPDTMGTAQSLVNLGGLSIGEKLTHGFVGKLIGGIFGGGTSVTDSGLQIGKSSLNNISEHGATVNQYTDTKTDGGWFSSDKHRTKIDSLGADVNKQFSMIITSLASTVSAGATALGLGGNAFTEHLKTFVVDISKISTKDMTGDQIQKALETELSKLGDNMARFGVAGLDQYQKVGEGYLETLSRVANDYVQVGDVMAVLGKNFNVTGLAAVSLSEGLITAAGGIDALTKNTGFFVTNFLSESEQMAPIVQSVRGAMAALGASGVTTNEQFKNLVLSQDLSTAAGQAMYASLTAIAPQFKQTADYINGASVAMKSGADIASERKGLLDQLDTLTMSSIQLLDKQRLALDASNRALFDQVQAATRAAAAVTAAQQGIDTARANLTTAYGAESSALKSTIANLKTFQAGILSFRDSLRLGSLSTLTPEQKAAEAQRQYQDTLAKAKTGDATAQAAIQAAASAYLTADQVIKASSDAYIADAAKVQSDLAALASMAGDQATDGQKQLDAMTQQVSNLVTLNATALSTRDGILALNNALMAGARVGINGSHAGGLVSVPFNGYLAELHRDEVVVDAPAAAAMRRYFGAAPSQGGGNNGALVAEIKALREEMKGRRADAERQTGDWIASNFEANDRAATKVSNSTTATAKASAWAASNPRKVQPA